MSPTRTAQFTPGAGGVVTDTDLTLLEADQTAAGANYVLINGVPTEINGWTYLDLADPLGASGELRGVAEARFEASANDDRVVSDSLGAVGRATGVGPGSGGVGPRLTGTYYLPMVVHDDEMILAPQDGVSPLVRYAGRVGALAAAAGTISNEGDNTILGVGTTFTTQAPVGSYVSIGGYPSALWRVVRVESNTRLSVAGRLPGAFSGRSWLASNYGLFGVGVLVTDLGQVANPSSTTLTGTGTAFLTPTAGRGRIYAGDFVARATGGTFDTVSSVSSDIAGVLIAGGILGTGAAPYRALRSATGRFCSRWQGRLWWGDNAWEPGRLYTSPPGWTPESLGNGVDSLATAFSDAYQAEFVDVPAEGATGRIVHAIPTSGPLVIPRTEAVYTLDGEYPAIDVRLAQDEAGAISSSACLTAAGGAFWAGWGGLWAYRGRGVENLMVGPRRGRLREWQRELRLATNTAGIDVALGFLQGHLFLSYAFSSGIGTERDATWVYDLNQDVWVGDATGLAKPRFYWSVSASTDQDRMYAVNRNVRQLQRLGTVLDLSATATTIIHTNRVPMSVQVPPRAFMGEPGRIVRPTRAKITYRLIEGGNMTVAGQSFGPSGTNEEDPGILTAVVRPGAAAIGTTDTSVKARVPTLTITRDATHPSIFTVPSVQVFSRERRVRA